MKETELIDYISKSCYQNASVKVGIGDDMAIIASHPQELLVSADTLLESVHFTLADSSADQVAYKALAVNMSDMAAMGGYAEQALICLSLPQSLDKSWIKAFIDALNQFAKLFRIQIIGGDTTTWQGPIAISITILGRAHENGRVLRSGAHPGDLIYVSGPLGGSLLKGRHLKFKPRIHEAHQLMDLARPTSMIDISDGLSKDLRHICQASQCGAILKKDKIPRHRDLNEFSPEVALERAMNDGEDFELCFTIQPTKRPSLEKLGFQAIEIGVITEQAGEILWSDGTEIRNNGYEHTFD